MASRYFNQFFSSLNFNPVFIEGSFVVGTAGAVVPGSLKGNGVDPSSTLSLQRKSTGTYLLTLADPYNYFLGANFTLLPPLTGSLLIDGSSSIIVGKSYQIAASTAVSVSTPETQLGSSGTNWYTLGLPTNQTPYVGSPFVATSASSQLVGSSAPAVGTGFVQQIGKCNIDHVEVLGVVNNEINPTSSLNFDNGPGQTQPNNGAMIWFQTLVSSSGAPVNATAGTTIRYNVLLRNSSRTGYNEATTANPN